MAKKRPNRSDGVGDIESLPARRPERSTSIQTQWEPADESANNDRGLLKLTAVSLVAGSISGFVGAAFRLALDEFDNLRNAFITWAHAWGIVGILPVVALCAAATALAAWLVRRWSPFASGSGIPHVEAVLQEEIQQTTFRLIPVKFLGGLLAIGSGLALGREGPTVQMGATISQLLGRTLRLDWPDCRALLAAGAGAGLATAFNAPIAGAVFVLEELVRRFDTRITVATFAASASAITVARLLVGDAPDYEVGQLAYPDSGTVAAYLVFGAATGILGVAYNRAILGALATAERLRQWPVEARAALIGAAVGLLAWYAPDMVGGGDPLTERTLQASIAVSALPIMLLVRFGLGAVSYAAGTPGGLFAPMLVLGSQAGLLFGTLYCRMFPDASVIPAAFAVTGMAAFFTAVVRAPLTGIILVIELTANYTQLLPMLAACLTAMLVPTLLRNPPIYDSLRPAAASSN